MAKTVDSHQIAQTLKERLKQHTYAITAEPVGEVLSVSDGVARLRGLSQIGYQELVTFDDGINGVALSLDDTEVGVVVLGDYLGIKEGDRV